MILKLSPSNSTGSGVGLERWRIRGRISVFFGEEGKDRHQLVDVVAGRQFQRDTQLLNRAGDFPDPRQRLGIVALSEVVGGDLIAELRPLARGKPTFGIGGPRRSPRNSVL